MQIGSIDRKTRDPLFCNTDTGLPGATQTLFFFIQHDEKPLFLLGLFNDDLFVSITHTLAFVRLRRPYCTNLRSDLADSLAISSFNHDFRRRRSSHRNTCRHLNNYRMRKPKRKIQLITLRLSAVTHAHQGQLLFKPFAYANDHVVDKLSHGPTHGICFPRFISRLKRQNTILRRDFH